MPPGLLHALLHEWPTHGAYGLNDWAHIPQINDRRIGTFTPAGWGPLGRQPFREIAQAEG